MTGSAVKTIHDAIGSAAKAAGFSKKGASWYAERNESLLVIAPQKSQYGQKFFLNLGVFFREFGPNQWPKSHECHLQARLEDVVSVVNDRSIIDVVLDFESADISDEDRAEKITDFLACYAIPFLENCSTFAGVREAEKNGALKSIPILRRLREHL